MNDRKNIDQCEVQQILLNHGYEMVDVVGEGGCGMVFKVFSLKYKMLFVAKAISLNNEKGPKLRKSFETEVKMISHLEHPNIIKIYDSFIDSDYCFQILEFCENGSLESLLKNVSELQSSEITFFIQPIIEALDYLHSLDIAHCDIKPSNILLGAFNRPVLADFGIARYFDSNDQARHIEGSLPYMAPEISSSPHYDPRKCDIWALGVTIYELSTGELPFSPIINRSSHIRLVQCPNSMDPNVSQAIYKMLKTDPRMRITAHDLLSLPLFKVNHTQNSKLGQCPKNSKPIESIASLRFVPNRTSLPNLTNTGITIVNSAIFKNNCFQHKSPIIDACNKIGSDEDPPKLIKPHFNSTYRIPQNRLFRFPQFHPNPF